MLLGHNAATVSPLAGFTVHAEGFLVGGGDVEANWTSELFPGWRRVTPAQQSRADLETFALTDAAGGLGGAEDAGRGAAAWPECVIWDTPDFDSLAARQYQRGVLEIAGLADLYLVVLSKEKYSDLSVWRMLELLEPLDRPLLLCVNKMTPDADETIRQTLRTRLAERGRGWKEAEIVSLPYDPAMAAGRGTGDEHAARRLRETVLRLLANPASAGPCPPRGARGVTHLLQQHWDEWLGPVHAEHAAAAEWQQLVDGIGSDFMAAYTRDYLEHPERYDAFRRSALELLKLLELPRIGSVIATARRIVTTPARLVFGALRGAARRAPLRWGHAA